MSATAGVLLFTFVAGGVFVSELRWSIYLTVFCSAPKFFFGGDAGIAATAYSQSESFTLPLQQGLALSAIPVIFTSFVFTVACRVLSAIWMATFVS